MGNYLQHQKTSNHSLHDLYNYSAIFNVAATVLGKQDPVTASMANQMELAS